MAKKKSHLTPLTSAERAVAETLRPHLYCECKGHCCGHPGTMTDGGAKDHTCDDVKKTAAGLARRVSELLGGAK